MTSDTLLGFVGIGVSTVFGFIGVIMGIYGICDGRRERSCREKAVNRVHEILGRTEGLLIGLKPAFSTNINALNAANDGLQALKIAQQQIHDL